MKYPEKIIGRVITEVYDYMEKTGRPDSFARFPYLNMLVERFSEREETEKELHERSERKTAELERFGTEDAIQAERYKVLLDKLSCGREDVVLITAVNLAIAVTQVTEFAAYLNYYTGNRATLQLACEMCGEFCPDHAVIEEQWKRLGRAFYVEKKNPPSYANIEAGQELLAYLTGKGAPGIAFCEGAELFCHGDALHPMYVRTKLADAGEKLLAKGDTILQICGSGGRRFLVKHLAKRMEKDVLFVRADQICGEAENREHRLMRIVHEAFLYACIVCIYEKEEGYPGQEESWAAQELLRAVRVLSEADIPVIVCTKKDEGMNLPNGKKTAWIRLEPLSREERALVWKGFSKQYHFEENIERCSVKYRMNASEIARAAEEWESTRMAAESGRFSDICYRILRAGEKQSLGTVITPRVSLSDLIVSEQIKETLGEICCGATKGYRIYEEWGLEAQYPYGKNISVLLAGAPGTGKTMTAHVLAHEIGTPLYQVDLPHIMDKYIGETEKHLEEVFDFAAKTNMVLFFDEADALFGKRGEVTEGKDRYANMEVSYLLQRMEQFDGIVVLATNFYQHIDRAFLRRIKYVLKYQEPDEKLRKRMWESCLTPSLPRDFIDTAYLARQFALSGGVIKNVVQSACIAAVYEERPLCMEHVLRAIRMEYEKLDRSVTSRLWGEYGYLMEQGGRGTQQPGQHRG